MREVQTMSTREHSENNQQSEQGGKLDQINKWTQYEIDSLAVGDLGKSFVKYDGINTNFNNLLKALGNLFKLEIMRLLGNFCLCVARQQGLHGVGGLCFCFKVV